MGWRRSRVHNKIISGLGLATAHDAAVVRQQTRAADGDDDDDGGGGRLFVESA